MSQLSLPIAWSQRGEPASLLVNAANEAALALLDDPTRWPAHCTLLVGPRHSGRSLIGRLFASRHGADSLIDDADDADEEMLFLRWNMARDATTPLLLVAREAPPVWAVRLPDLRTRLATAAVARILPPDEGVAAAVIAHGLEQAGSAFAPDLPDFVARRVTRCYDALASVAACLNAESLSSGRKLTVASARVALAANGLLAEVSGTEQGEGSGPSG